MKPIPTESSGTWRPCDEAVSVIFDACGNDGDGPRPLHLRWRGSSWRVVGPSRHWSTWRVLPVTLPSAAAATAGSAPTRRWRTEFWRFRGQIDPASPILHFEVRRSDTQWRLVRLGASFELPGRAGSS